MYGAIFSLLLCLSALPLGQSMPYSGKMHCQFEGQVALPGQTVTIERECARHRCTCDPRRGANQACESEMTGCHDSDTQVCYTAGQAATVNRSDGSRMHCTCQQNPDGTFIFAKCLTETCKDAKTGEEKKKGESVSVVSDGVAYVCTCAGVDGYKACRTEESISNDGKCLDHLSGKYVTTGTAATTKQGDAVLYCTCAGTGHYVRCLTKTCPDVDGSVKKEGEKVTVSHGDKLLVCDCAGLDGYKNCQLKADYENAGKCLDHLSGKYVAAGSTATTKQGDAVLYCTCASTGNYKYEYVQCRTKTCPDVDGSVKNEGEKVTVKNFSDLLVCDCAGLDGYKNCQLKADYENPGKCMDIEGRYADKGARYRVKYGGAIYECTCDGNRSGNDCSIV